MRSVCVTGWALSRSDVPVPLDAVRLDKRAFDVGPVIEVVELEQAFGRSWLHEAGIGEYVHRWVAVEVFLDACLGRGDLTPVFGPPVKRVGCRGQHASGGQMLLGFGS